MRETSRLSDPTCPVNEDDTEPRIICLGSQPVGGRPETGTKDICFKHRVCPIRSVDKVQSEWPGVEVGQSSS